MAARPRALDGLTVGLLNNAKLNADRLLEDFYRALDGRYRLARAVHHKKEMTSRRFDPQVIEDVVRRCQLAITAVGD